jgi:polyphosphate glucokinase
VEDLLHPQRFVLGGSISKDSAQYLPFAEVSTPTVPARFHNDAGIIGAALIASGYSGSS